MEYSVFSWDRDWPIRDSWWAMSPLNIMRTTYSLLIIGTVSHILLAIVHSTVDWYSCKRARVSPPSGDNLPHHPSPPSLLAILKPTFQPARELLLCTKFTAYKRYEVMGAAAAAPPAPCVPPPSPLAR
ncbi:hypothetical protein J6590_051880 [Homalodisca vitripennis]|nr:hypothetical protein J6590_051880 [Homalodisca vitripennis]